MKIMYKYVAAIGARNNRAFHFVTEFVVISNQYKFVSQRFWQQRHRVADNDIQSKSTKTCQSVDGFRHYKLFAWCMEVYCDEDHAVDQHNRITFSGCILSYAISIMHHNTNLCFTILASQRLDMSLGLFRRLKRLPYWNVFDLKIAVLDMFNTFDCDFSAIITCSWCAHPLCLQHCLLQYFHDVGWRMCLTIAHLCWYLWSVVISKCLIAHRYIIFASL